MANYFVDHCLECSSSQWRGTYVSGKQSHLQVSRLSDMNWNLPTLISSENQNICFHSNHFYRLAPVTDLKLCSEHLNHVNVEEKLPFSSIKKDGTFMTKLE